MGRHVGKSACAHRTDVLSRDHGLRLLGRRGACSLQAQYSVVHLTWRLKVQGHVHAVRRLAGAM